MSAIESPKATPPSGPSPRSSAVPLLSDSKPAEDTSDQSGLLSKGKRILGLGKRKEGDKKEPATAESNNSLENRPAMPPATTPTLAASPPLSTAGRPSSPLSPPMDRSSPRGSPRVFPAGVGASPNRRSQYRSASPGLHSPASSQIFERNVQENAIAGELSPAIPSHIQTEDHIPPALEASSLAITDDHLNPDEVEIVMHSAHQPASAAVAGSVTDSIYSPSQDDFSTHTGHPDIGADSASNYGALDTADVRRLSFISFADVVQAEHVESNRDAMQFVGLSSAANRSPSPVRSPASSHGFSASPPTSGATSEKGADYVSKSARAPGSPTHGTSSPPLGGELQIETMRQALRKTGSGDLSGARSQPLSAVSLEESAADVPPFH